MCLLGLVAACDGPGRLRLSPPRDERVDTWIVARDPAVAYGVTAPTAPALVARATGTPELLGLTHTRVGVTVVGPIASVDRTKSYETPGGAHELLVSFTPPATPARQDYVVHVGARALTVHVCERLDAQELARTLPQATLVATDANGRIDLPVGAAPAKAIELRVETTGLVPWRDGAYELTVPRAPDGDVALTADVYGPGPIVVVNSPSHAIDAKPVSLEHLRVALREPQTLRDDDFVLRYRVDPADRPGAFVVERDGSSQVVGLVVHPFENAHEPVAVSDVTIDWNGASVTEVRPATIGRLAAGTPLVVLARAQGDVPGPITLRARVGREQRTLTLARDDAIPGPGLRGLPLLWARAARVTVPAHR